MPDRTQTIRALTCRRSRESQEPWDVASITSAWLSLLKWGRAAGEGKSASASPNPASFLSEGRACRSCQQGHSQTMPTGFCLDLL